MLHQAHYDHHPIDTEVSNQFLRNYIESYDYNHLFFIQPEPKVEVASISDEGTYRCTLNSLVRTLPLTEDDPATGVPCRVSYKKNVEAPGMPEELWTADSVPFYCRKRVDAFLLKLREMG